MQRVIKIVGWYQTSIQFSSQGIHRLEINNIQNPVKNSRYQLFCWETYSDFYVPEFFLLNGVNNSGKGR